MKNTDGMICALKADLFKLKKHKSVWIGMAVMFVIILLVYCMYWIGLGLVEKITIPDDPDAFAAQQEAIALLTPLGRTCLAGFSDTCALTLFVAIITCLFVGKDFSNGAVRIEVSRGANRTQLFFSKWISLALLVVFYSVFAILICGLFTSFKGYGEPFTAQQFGLLMRCFALQILYGLSCMSIVLMLAFLCRSSGASLGATIGGSIAISIIFGLASTIGSMNGNTDWVMFMPLQQSAVASSMEKYTAAQLCAVIIMPIVYGAISTAIALLTFLKRDIK